MDVNFQVPPTSSPPLFSQVCLLKLILHTPLLSHPFPCSLFFGSLMNNSGGTHSYSYVSVPKHLTRQGGWDVWFVRWLSSFFVGGSWGSN